MARFNLEIFVPYMECPCGLSSPEQDRQAEIFQTVLQALKDKYREDISYMIFALNLHLQSFRSRPELAAILQEEGKKGLPVVFINGSQAFKARYPGLDELEAALSSVYESHEQP